MPDLVKQFVDAGRKGLHKRDDEKYGLCWDDDVQICETPCPDCEKCGSSNTYVVYTGDGITWDYVGVCFDCWHHGLETAWNEEKGAELFVASGRNKARKMTIAAREKDIEENKQFIEMLLGEME